ncbi:MAG: metallophosphoesterase, partial [Tissierellia bacterium]|nr:metallophosphoesterase [Tissierellia bacterium]
VNFDKLDINEVLIEVSNAKGVSEDVKQEALKRIANSQMKDLGGDL